MQPRLGDNGLWYAFASVGSSMEPGQVTNARLPMPAAIISAFKGSGECTRHRRMRHIGNQIEMFLHVNAHPW